MGQAIVYVVFPDAAMKAVDETPFKTSVEFALPNFVSTETSLGLESAARETVPSQDAAVRSVVVPGSAFIVTVPLTVPAPETVMLEPAAIVTLSGIVTPDEAETVTLLFALTVSGNAVPVASTRANVPSVTEEFATVLAIAPESASVPAPDLATPPPVRPP